MFSIPRVRSVGDPPMPLNDDYPMTVAFVVGMRTNLVSAVSGPEPIGTAFFVGVPVGIEGVDAIYTYAVTARHVVACETQGTWLRINLVGGGWEDVAVPSWTKHPTADVAVALMGDRRRFAIKAVPLHMFADRVSVRPVLGDPVYFIGLLAGSDLAEANVPIVRSGTLGAMYQPDIAMEDCTKTIVRWEAHLIDCRSYSGFSGSPCFVEYRIPQKESMNKGPRAEVVLMGRSIIPEVLCFGLISGHWDQFGEGETQTGEKVSFPINSGVGIATPIEKIRECLMDPDLAAQREESDQALAQAIKEAKDKRAAVADSVADEPTLTKGEFEAALRKVSQRKASPPDRNLSE